MILRIYITEKEEYQIGRYRVILLKTDRNEVVGAIIESPRKTKPIYVAIKEKTKLKLPKEVIKFLVKHGFNVERA